MRRFQKMLAASVLLLIPAASASAQQDYQGGGRQNRQNRNQFDGQNNQNNGDQQFGNRQSRQNRNFGGDNTGNNGGQFGGGRQRYNSDNSSSSGAIESTPVRPAAKPDSTGFKFVAPVNSGPITFPAQPLPKEYVLLMSKSIFSKNHLAVQPDAKPPVFVETTVAALVLRGAMREGTHYLANIEDTGNSKKITWVSEGDLLTSNGARVTEITLDHIVVEKNGGRRLITIGINLDAGERMTVATSGGPTASAATGSSPVNVTASTAGTSSDEDVAEMMRRRRLQEIGQ